MKLRDYQERAVSDILNEFMSADTALAVLPTGCGKTMIFCEIARRIQPQRTLVIAHREELIYQARDRAAAFGLTCEVEMAGESVRKTLFNPPTMVVSTIQTQVTGGEAQTGRMQRFDPKEFGLLVIDESHRATANSYVRLIEYYRQNANLKVLGVTATPDRTDEQALGQVFETVAVEYELLDAIYDGWLVPIDQQMIAVKGLDFSHVRATKNDLNEKDLAHVVENESNLHRIASPAVEIIGDKRALIFAASVRQADMLCEIMNRYAPGRFRMVHAGTPKEERRELIADYRSGKVQGVCNVGIMTEGVDVPEIEVVIMARPTKSRIVYSQAIGRGTRPLPGVVDGIDEPEARKEAIAASPKPRLLVVDFAGNAGRHKLVHSGDILGGRVQDEVVEEFARRARASGKPTRVTDEFKQIAKELRERKEAEAQRRAGIMAKAQYLTRSVSPFDAWDLSPSRARGWHNSKSLTDKQREMLVRQGIDPTNLSHHEATQLIGEQIRRWKLGLCSFRQARVLKRYGYETAELKREDASKIMDQLKANGWKRLERQMA